MASSPHMAAVQPQGLRGLSLGRVLRSLGRRWFEWQMDRLPTEPYDSLVHLGGKWGGGWVVPDDLIDKSWVCYCIGAGSDVDFDLELIERFGARVRCVDPSRAFREKAEAAADGDPRFSFYEVALAPRDGPLPMYGAEDPESGSLSAANLYGTDRLVTVPGKTLSSLMAEAGDERVDLLKLDIEGSEYEVLPELDLPGLGVRVLCVELHPTRPVIEAKQLVEHIRSQGFRLVYCHHPASFTFIS